LIAAGSGTKDRVHSIREEMQPKLGAYMAGIAKDQGIHAVAGRCEEIDNSKGLLLQQ
jgi:hypothetical protein